MESNCTSFNRSFSSSHDKVKHNVIWICCLNKWKIFKTNVFHTRSAVYFCLKIAIA
ncbi:hypothetical protein OIU77_018127 [Salix suchowensis]|uniref:Uncharacterized protein n=1 Tax=Salix suchowensis TaxID=1278906 RepID=A0ABQ8ZRS5_9ROSI|nr:hypothetical protein OIU77_018127 [Salix suchowensis]